MAGDGVQSFLFDHIGGVYESSTTLWQEKEQKDQQKQDTQTGKSAAHVYWRTEEFNRRLREQPGNTELWIQFIQYQVRRL